MMKFNMNVLYFTYISNHSGSHIRDDILLARPTFGRLFNMTVMITRYSNKFNLMVLLKDML